MKLTDKEYPATHSMSTAWYIVDEEGNVGIMDYNENGPIPWGVPETCVEELVYGSDFASKDFLYFDLTDEQIMDLLKEPHSPLDEDKWYDCAVKVVKDKENSFVKLCDHPDINKGYPFCLSKKLSIYQIEAYKCAYDKNYNKIEIHGTLKTMIDEGLIEEVYKIQEFYMNDNYSSGQVTHVKEFDKAPYYMYHQAYSTSYLPQRLHIPDHPVKIEQIPVAFRQLMHKIPVKFKETEWFQIAQFMPCDSYDTYTHIVNGCYYQECVLTDGSIGYSLKDVCRFDNCHYCSYFENRECESCKKNCCVIKSMPYTNNPTILGVYGNEDGSFYHWTWKVLTMDLLVRSLIVSFEKRGIDTDKLKSHFISIIKDIKPRLVLFTEKTYNQFLKLFDLSGNMLSIEGIECPVSKISDITTEDIRRKTSYDYRGVNHPVFITKEEMQALESRGQAIKIINGV